MTSYTEKPISRKQGFNGAAVELGHRRWNLQTFPSTRAHPKALSFPSRALGLSDSNRARFLGALSIYRGAVIAQDECSLVPIDYTIKVV